MTGRAAILGAGETGGTERLDSLQLLRGIAALLVVLFHAADIWRDGTGAPGLAGPWDQGWAGVDLFFVISGFVMVWVALDRPSGPRTAARFLFDRVTRIYPLWWVFCGLMALYFLMTYGQPASPSTSGPDGAATQFWLSMALWPTGDYPVLGVGWTLVFEMAFYILFAGLLLLSRGWRMPLIGIWSLLLIGRVVMGPLSGDLPAGWLGVLANPICLEFAAGAGAAYLLQRRSVPTSISLAATGLGVVGFAAAMALSGDLTWAETMGGRTLLFGGPATLIVFGLAGLDRAGRMRAPAFLRRLGDASYTLYLSHFLVLLVLRRLGQSVGLFMDPGVPSMMLFMGIGTLASLIAAMVFYVGLERPLLRLSRRLWPRSERPVP